MNTNLKISALLVLFAGAGLVIAATLSGTGAQADAESGGVALVRDDSHRLSEPGSSDVTLVEFLDFECEACGAVYPFVEELREEYGDRVTFVARYFPLPAHPNSENAAVAVEAAAQQGAFEDMYQRMFETQETWGHREESQAPVFRQYAADLGLDMAAYDAAVSDPATLERVRRDKADGLALGVQGTPTFFLGGELLQPSSAEEFHAAIEDAIDG